MLFTPQDMFSLYSQITALLGYPQEFDATDDLWDCGIDEIAPTIAQTNSELNPQGFFC